MFFRRALGFVFLRNLVLALIVGSLTGLLTSSISTPKKGNTSDVVLGIVGAVLASLLLVFLRGGVKLVPLLIVQLVGSLLLILLGRLLMGEK